ncbi:hypothetical protein WICANDRAFT_31332 [Wickerhamomyces anomalus NRRL Y-366-8]|uniref:GOLD domain-containing protein n=1 Tax=Wickerhamomyces anomalus (strain ATCC 58044 / CBS 1984 / NCYC 433 / NRRL Y-366-8) TaxID=683960 RepID=A0A1E3P4K9_WICAA|nr:uncharacterized protein WICANDRAFT_31332 [Wickerhamomyces anomalus NRRL Y-366-8]ODQ60248.1 hypothetical protein WICANDRAFT_31332 [Wickerhamomyces anomalus NRRL Y-366-8]
MWNPLLALVLIVQLASALHFYTVPGETRCFYEELTKGTVVIGKFDAYVNSRGDAYEAASNLKLAITVDETFDNDHRVVSQKSSSSGDFTFSALDSGEHKFCITPSYVDKRTKVRVFFDLVLAGAETIDSKRQDEVSVLTNKVKQLSNKVQEIQREQKLMREREALFRDQSESTNSKVVRWSVIQLIVLLGTCAWQLQHLKGFFIKQKVL